MSIVSVKNDTVTRTSVINAAIPLAPVINSINILVAGVILDDTAIDTLQTPITQTIQINGTGFVSGAIITLGGSAVTTAYVSPNTLTFTAPAKTANTYPIYVLNPDGGTAIYIPGLVYSGTPAWTTAAGTLGTVYETNSISTSALATTGVDTPIVYSVVSGALPAGSSLNSSTGVITGTSQATGVAASILSTFIIRATDAQLQDSDREFTITVNTDVVTMANTSVSLEQNTASNTALTATSAAGKAISYTSTALPAGLSIVGTAVTGTPTVVAVTATTFTATAATTNRTATATITWTVSVAADQYVMYNTLLLSGSASTETFIADASANNFALAIVQDTKPNNFNPYTPGYYSNYFDGSGDYVSVPSNSNWSFAGQFTLEAWFYWNVSPAAGSIIGAQTGGSFDLYNTGSALSPNVYGSGNIFTSTFFPLVGVWYHIAITRNSSNLMTMWVNGVSVGSATTSASYTTGTYYIGSVNNTNAMQGYISNFRIVNGTAVYTGNFTPSTTPLTAIANTSLLTCQSNRFIDNSSNAFAVTVAGNTTINPRTPFVPNTAYAAYGSTYFDGNGDYLIITPAQPSLGLGTGDFTAECWAYRTAVVNYQVIFRLNDYNTGLLVRTESPTYNDNFYYVNSGYDWNPTLNFPINRWTHICVTRQSGTLRLFVNGIIIVSVTNTTNAPSATAEIGTAGYIGYISNFRVVKGTAVYATASTTIGAAIFTPPTAPLTAVTGTSLLTLQTNQPASNSMFLDSSTNAFLVTRAGNTSAGTFSPYGANWSNYFGTKTDYISVPATTALTTFTGNFTFECWIHPITGAPATNWGIWDSRNSGQTASAMVFTLATGPATGQWYLSYYYGPSTQTYGTGIVYADRWTHVAFVRSGSTLTYYVNGVAGNAVNIGAGTHAGTATSNPVYIGTKDFALNGYGTLGYISNFRIVNGVAVYTGNFTPPTAPLTAVQSASGAYISAITGSATSLLTCQSNGPVDNSVNAYALTLASATVSTQRFSPFAPQTQTAITHSNYLDGTGDYLLTPSSSQFNLTGDFTIECWIYKNNPSVDGNGIFGIGTQDPDSSLVRIYTGKLQFWLGGSNSGGPGTGTKTGIRTCATTISSYTWYHVALVRSGSSANNVKLYLNGVLDGQGTATYEVPTGYFVIGRDYPTLAAEYFPGYISNLRVVKGVAVYTANFTPPTTPLTATQSANTNGNPSAAITSTQTSLLTSQSPTFVDNSSNNFALTAFDNAKPSTINPFGFTNATAAYSAATYGASAYFDGTTDYLSAAANAAFQFTGDYTVEFWVNFSSLSTEVDLVGNYISNVSTDWMILKLPNSFLQYYPSSAASYINGPIPVANRWYHVVIGRSGTSCKLYVDGISYGALTFSGTLGDASKSVYIGSRGGSANMLTGYISNVRIVKGKAVYTSNFVPPAAPLTAITNTSLLLNMNSAGIYDSASMNDLETVADAKRVSTHTPYAGSYYSNYFDGAGDYLSVPTNTALAMGTGDFTCESWVYISAAPGNLATLWGDLRWSGGYQSGWSVHINPNLTITSRISGTSGSWVEVNSTTTVNLNSWNYIAVSRQAGTFRNFVNGVLSGSQASANYNYTNAETFKIGITYADGLVYAFTGYIANVRLVKGTAVYTGNTFAVPTAPLTAIANTSLLTCQSNRFVDNSTNAFAITRYDNTSVQSFNPFQRNSGTTLYFDGTGDYLLPVASPQYAFGTSDFTVEGWIYATAASDSPIYDSRTNGSGTTGFTLTAFSSSVIRIYTGSASLIASSNTTYLNAWTHVAVVRSGGTTTLYINGTSAGTSASMGNLTDQSTVIGGGRYSGTSSISAYFTGYINDLRITKGIARYPAAFANSIPTTAFIAR